MSQPATARTMSKITKYRDYLTERIDPDTILDCLLANRILSKREVDEVKSRLTIYQKTERLLDYIIEKDKEEEFINALRDASQRHLANYLSNDGVRQLKFLGDWPLEETQIMIIDTNCGSLKDVIDIKGGLVDHLLAHKVISHRQKQLICCKPTESERNEVFLDILRRGSMGHYNNTIQCLRLSNQDHIADILHEGGALIPVHAELQESLDEERLVEVFKDLLRNRTVEEFNRIVEMKKLKVIDAKLGHSVIFYFYCKTSKLWQELKNSKISESLKVTIEELCKRMDSQTGVFIKTIHINDPDYEKIERYFAKKVVTLDESPIDRCLGIPDELFPPIHSPFSPESSLPTEILHLILHQTLAASEDGIDLGAERLSKVCQTWNTVLNSDRFKRHHKRIIEASMKPYLLVPVLLETRIVSSSDRLKPIIGVCILERLLYIAQAETPSIDIFSIPDISPSDLHLSIVPDHVHVRSLYVPLLKMPFDMAASAQSTCLFLTDFFQNVGCVWRVKPEGDVTKLADNVGIPFGISVSRDNYVVVVSERPSCLRVFSQSGERVCEMSLDCEAPRQAICLEPGKFALIHGYLDPVNRLVELDSSGHVMRCYGSTIGAGYSQIHWPEALISDNRGRMLACDRENCRVHLVQKDFRLRRRLVQLDRFSDAKPRRLCIDDLNGTLYIGQTDSTIKVYRIAYPFYETSSDHEDLLVKGVNCFCAPVKDVEKTRHQLDGEGKTGSEDLTGRCRVIASQKIKTSTMPKKKPVTTERGQHHQHKWFWINLIKDINLTKIDANVIRKHPDSFEKKKVRLEKKNSDPQYLRQTVIQEFQSLTDEVEFSFWRLSKDNPTLIPLPSGIDNAASLCNYDELNRSSLYIRLQALPNFIAPSTSTTQPHQCLELIDSTGQQANESSISQETNAEADIHGEDGGQMQVLNQSCFEQLLGPAGNLLISPLYQVSLTALANTVKPETAVIEEATANKCEMVELLGKEKSVDRGGGHSSRVLRKRKIAAESDQEFMRAKQYQSSSAQERVLMNEPIADFWNYNTVNRFSPIDQVPQTYTPFLDNCTWDFGQRSMVVPYALHTSCPSNLSNPTVLTTYPFNVTDSIIAPEQWTMQNPHQQQLYAEDLTSFSSLDLRMHKPQQPFIELQMVSQNASSSGNTRVSQETASNVSQVPCAQPRGVIQIERGKHICEFAAMNGKLYITYMNEDTLLVYSSSSPFQKEKEVRVNGMKHPDGIAAFAEENCLFISDGENASSKCIWMVTDAEEVVCKKLVEDIGCYRLSVTHDGELLIVSDEDNCIHLYKSDGRCFCCVKLPDEFNSYVPVYAAKSLRESFYVSVVWTTEYKNNKTLYSMVYKLSMDGDIVKTFGGREGRGSGQLRYSYHPMAVDKHGRVIVGDAGNDRILMLDSNLQLLTIILDKDDLKDGFRFEKVRMDANASFIFVEDERHDIRIFNFSEFQPNRMNETSSNIFSRAMPGTDKFHLLFSIEGKESDDGEESDEIRGVATLAYSIYILKRCSITVYDSTNPYIKKYYGAFDGDLWDIAANAYDGCLYVTDKEKKCIWSADIDLRRKKWLEGIGSPYTLSVARDGSVLILSNKDQSLSIYDKDGLQPQSRIRFSCKRTMHLQHAVKLSYSRGHETYLVCHGLSVSQDTIDEYDYIYDSFVLSHEVFVASANGDILQTFGGKLGSSSNQLNLPSHIVVYKDDTMLVADCNNNRVLRLDHQLNLQNIPLSKDVHSIDEPFRVCYSENTGQIIVANSNSVDIFVNDDFRRCQGEDDSDSAVNNDTSESEMPCVQLIGQVADIQLQKDKTCRGAAVLQDHMYLIYDYTDTVYVYSSDHPYELLSQIVHQQMEDPICIVASVEHNCVYVADESTIWRLVRNGQECETFLSFDYMCSISINEEGHLLVAYYVDNDSFVSTYDADGRCIQVIGFLPRRDIYYAVKSGSKTVFVNWHSSDKKCDAMSEVSLNGDLLHTYGPHINEYFRCIGMSLGEDDQILVNDKSNGGRILVFGSRARLIGVLLGKDDHQMTQITGLCYIKDKKQLLVIGPDRVNIYQLNKNQGPQIDGHYRKVALDVEDPTPSNGDTGQLLYSRIPGDEDGQLCVRAVGKLGEKHYLLYSNSFEVFSRQDLVTKVEFGEGALEIPKSRYCNSDNGGLWDIAASETDLCLYVSDRYNHCVWSVSIDHKIKKWLANIGSPYTLSVTEDGSLCILSNYHKYLHLYDRSGNKKTSIELPRYMKYLLHAVQTPKGTYVVSWTENIQEGAYDGTRRNASNFVKKKSDTKKDPEKQGDGSDTKMDDDEEEEEEEEEEEKKKKKDEQQLLDHEDVVFEESHKSCVCSEESETQKRGLVCEISSDGSTLRSFRANPQHDQIDTCDSRYLFQLEIPCYLALDQEGRVLVADYHGSNRVLLLDSQLKFLANVTEKFQLESYKAKRLCYDINSKELTVIQSRCGFPSSIMCIRM